MWAVTPTYDQYGNMLVGLSKQEQMTIQAVKSKDVARARLSVPNLTRMSQRSFKTLVRGGLPGTQRIELWMNACGASQMQESYPVGYFESLTDWTAIMRMVPQAEHAVSRRMPGHRMLTSQGGLFTSQIVHAYCAHTDRMAEENLYVLAAFLISVKGDSPLESCFWLLTSIFTSILPAQFSSQEEVGHRGHLESHVLAALAEKHLPKLCSHLNAIGFSLTRETSPWFSNLFVGVLPALTVIRIWDVLLCEGRKILYRVALTLLKRLEVNSSVSLASNMSWRYSRMFDAEVLMKAAYKGMGSFPAAAIKRLEILCGKQSKLLQTGHARRLEALLCPAPQTPQCFEQN